MARTPVAASLILYISLQVGSYENYVDDYYNSMELNVVQIIFARMNATRILHIIANEQIYVCAYFDTGENVSLKVKGF